MVGFERLYKDGMLAVVHGCGYDHPSLSHFSSMGFWHTGVPNGGEALGWLGRLADAGYDASTRNVIVNVGSSQSLAVRSQRHSPLVFDDPARFRREGSTDEVHLLAGMSQAPAATNATLEFLATTARNATDSSDFVRQASADYRTTVDYGAGGGLAEPEEGRGGSSPQGCGPDLYVTMPGIIRPHRSAGRSPRRLRVHRRRNPRVVETLNASSRNDCGDVPSNWRRVEETNHRPTCTATLFSPPGRESGLYDRTQPHRLDDGNLKMTTDFSASCDHEQDCSGTTTHRGLRAVHWWACA